MSNFNPDSYFQLDVNAPLFKALSSEKPSWWEIVKNDSRIYINIRKGGYISVYCRGKSIMKLEYSGGNYRATTNTYYLSDEEKKGKAVQLSPEDIVKRMDEIIDRMLRRRPVGKDEGDLERGIEDYIRNVVLEEQDYIMKERTKLVDKYFGKYNGRTASENIYDIIVKLVKNEEV